jgi:hypothetical protein
MQTIWERFVLQQLHGLLNLFCLRHVKGKPPMIICLHRNMWYNEYVLLQTDRRNVSTYLLSTMKLISLRVRQYVNSKGLEKPVMACFMAMYHKQLKGLRKNTFNVSQNKWCPRRDPNRAPPKYKSWCTPKWSVKNPYKTYKPQLNRQLTWCEFLFEKTVAGLINKFFPSRHSNLTSMYTTSCPLKHVLRNTCFKTS